MYKRQLDTRTSIEIMGLFQRLNVERGITVIVITHEPDIAEYATRTMAFRDGLVVSDRAVARRRDAVDAPVSYTHLMPPTSDLVEYAVASVS